MEEALHHHRHPGQLGALEAGEDADRHAGEGVEQRTRRQHVDHHPGGGSERDDVDHGEADQRDRDREGHLDGRAVGEQGGRARAIACDPADERAVEAEARQQHRDLGPGQGEHEHADTRLPERPGHRREERQRRELRQELPDRPRGRVARGALEGRLGALSHGAPASRSAPGRCGSWTAPPARDRSRRPAGTPPTAWPRSSPCRRGP